jgi:hypothetical protein
MLSAHLCGDWKAAVAGSMVPVGGTEIGTREMDTNCNDKTGCSAGEPDIPCSCNNPS